MRTEALVALTGLAKNYCVCVKPLWVRISQAVAHNLRTDKLQRSPVSKPAVRIGDLCETRAEGVDHCKPFLC